MVPLLLTGNAGYPLSRFFMPINEREFEKLPVHNLLKKLKPHFFRRLQPSIRA